MRDILKESEKIQEEIKERLESDPDLTSTKKELYDLIEKLEKKLDICGSVDLVSKFALIELLAQTPETHNDEYPASENPFGLFLLGLFLNHNNLTSSAQEADFQEVYGLLVGIFQKNQLLLILNNIINAKGDRLSFQANSRKLLDDNNPHVFPKQKKEYVQAIFRPFNEAFNKELGFTIDDAYGFAKIIHTRLDAVLKNYSKEIQKIKNKTEEKYRTDKKYQEFLQENNMKFENVLSQYSNYLLLKSSTDALTIDFEKLCILLGFNNNEKICFKNYLNNLSCTFGEQVESFKTPSDENIIFYKPIIKLDENTFFICRPDVLEQRLEILFDYLLLDEKIKKSELWTKFNEIKSSYIEDKIFQWLRKVFGKKNIFRNLYYWIGSDRMEIDILVIYGEKIILLEAKSGFIPVTAKVHGEKIENRLKDLIKKPYQQNLSAHNYISSNSKSEFWNEDKTEKILTIEKKQEHEFLFLNITLEMLGGVYMDLKQLVDIGFYQKNTLYPWSVYFFDFEIILDILKDPIIFIHYIRERLSVNEEGVVESIDELAFLGYYLQHGNLKIQNSVTGSPNRIMLGSDFMSDLEKHYFMGEKKPHVPIPFRLKKQLRELNKKKKPAFVDEGCYLLDEFFGSS